MRDQRVTGGNRHVVIEAEAHGAVRLGVVARRAHAAERVFQFAGHHGVGGGHGGAGRVRGSGQRVAIHGGIRIDRVVAARGAHGRQLGDIVGPVHALDLLFGGGGRVAAVQQPVQPVRDQVILDRLQPFRAFRMEMSHLVQLECGMCVIARWHCRFRVKFVSNRYVST
ncbi:hypothetical protein D3C87_1346940 [compost metagenome]